MVANCAHDDYQAPWQTSFCSGIVPNKLYLLNSNHLLTYDLVVF